MLFLMVGDFTVASSEIPVQIFCPFYFLLVNILFIVVQVQFSAFPPNPPDPLSLPHLPPLFIPLVFFQVSLFLYTPPLFFSYVSFIIVPTNPSPFSPVIFPTLPSGHCQPVFIFRVFVYILLSCSFC